MEQTPRPLQASTLLMPFLVVFVFALMQTVCYWATRNIILSSLLSGPVSVMLLTRPVGPIRLRAAFRLKGLPRAATLLGLGAGITGITAASLLGELTQLPNPTAATFTPLLGLPLTWITVGLAGPICEELLFREGIQGGLVRKGMSPVWAIVIGSLLFSLAHANPAQSLAAISMGFVLGALYHRSQNVLLCSLIHVINNVLGLLQLRQYSGHTAATPLLDLLGSRALAWGVLAVLTAAVGLMLWGLFRHKRPTFD